MKTVNQTDEFSQAVPDRVCGKYVNLMNDVALSST